MTRSVKRIKKAWKSKRARGKESTVGSTTRVRGSMGGNKGSEETREQRDREWKDKGTREQGNKGMRGQGDKEALRRARGSRSKGVYC